MTRKDVIEAIRHQVPFEIHERSGRVFRVWHDSSICIGNEVGAVMEDDLQHIFRVSNIVAIKRIAV